MFKSLKYLDDDTRQIAWLSFGTLLAVMVAHAMLETARDALFLESIPSDRLPFVYLLIAGVSFGISLIDSTLRGIARADVALRAWLALSGVVTLGFWAFLERGGTVGLYALYVWTGVLITLAALQFWTMLDEFANLSSAKSIYAFVGAGSAVGAMIGSGAAAIIASFLDPRHLLGVAGGVLLLAVIGPQLLVAQNAKMMHESDKPESGPSLAETIQAVRDRSYPKRVAALIIAMTITLTIADYVFKAAAADAIAPDQLGTFFGAVYFGLNALSLVVQLFVVDRLIRRLSITGALAVLPIALVVTGLGFVAITGVVAAVALKAVDGAMRHSLNRTTVELLYVPMDGKVRARVKAFIDVLGQRGAQAFASLVILGALSLSPPDWALGAAVVVTGAAWIGAAVSIRRPYLELFRRDLEPHGLDLASEFGDLDVVSLESLVEALNADDPNRVLAALDLLRLDSKPEVIPGLIVWHPDRAVVDEALEIFVESNSTHFLRFAREAAEARKAPDLRASLVSAIARVAPERRELERYVSESDCPAVSMTAGFYLVANGWDEEGERRVNLERIYRSGEPDQQRTVARAIGSSGTRGFENVLIGFARRGTTAVQVEAVRAMRGVLDERFLPPLRDLLESRALRREARKTIRAFGSKGLQYLTESFHDETLSNPIRWQLPAAVAAFEPHDAADVLLTSLVGEADGMVRYRIVNQLGRLNDVIELDVEDEVLIGACDATIRRAFELIDWRVTLEKERAEDPETETKVFRLLERMLRDKEKNAIDLLIRVLGILFPSEDFNLIRRGLQRGDSTERAASRELIEYTLDSPIREAVLGLISDMPGEDRLQTGLAYYAPSHLPYRQLIDQLVQSSSRTLSAIAQRHIAEIDVGSAGDAQSFTPSPDSRSKADAEAG